MANEPVRSERDIESSQLLEDYVQQQNEAILPRFGFVALSSFLFLPSTVTVTVSIPESYFFSTTVVPKTVKAQKKNKNCLVRNIF